MLRLDAAFRLLPISSGSLVLVGANEKLPISSGSLVLVSANEKLRRAAALHNTRVKPKRFYIGAFSLLALLLAVFFGLRLLEHAMTYHPVPFSDSDTAWDYPLNHPSNAEDVWFTNAEGTRLHGWFFHSKRAPAHATVLHCHGNGGNLTNVRWFAEMLAERGFNTLIWDYRGYGRSGGKITDEWGLYADGTAAYEWLARERGVKPEHLILYGQSLGSTVAIDLATRKPAAALVIESGLSSASAMASSSLPWLPRWLHRIGKNRFESARKLATINLPVFIAHGTADEVVPLAQSQTNFAAAHEPKEYFVVEGGTHNLFGQHHAVLLERMTAFLEKNVRLR